MLVLGFESTCDETGVALVEDGRKVLANVIASSADVHAKFGGVFPEFAARGHLEVLPDLTKQALKEAGKTKEDVDLIAVAMGPGLLGSLLVGMQFAKGLSIAWNKPFIGVNHVEAHLYAAIMGLEGAPPLPALGLVLSGGHTLLLKVLEVGRYERIGTTVDDAVGEAFDKVATLLDLPYPGGPHVERLAKKGNPHRFPFSAGKVKQKPLDFSFSGLKTSVLYAIKGQDATGGRTLSEEEKRDVAASFQEAAFQDLAAKARLAADRFDCKALLFGGGVCQNLRLKEIFQEKFPEMPLLFPSPPLTLDNGAMIAALAYPYFLKRPVSDPLDLEPKTRIPIA
jgi:N6-L-threonylcarbamoyladenine synthase